MLRSIAIASLSYAVMSNNFGYGHGHGYNHRDINNVNTLNNIENRKILQVDNAVDQAFGWGNNGLLKHELKNELNGIIAQGTNQLNSLALNGGSNQYGINNQFSGSSFQRPKGLGCRGNTGRQFY